MEWTRRKTDRRTSTYLRLCLPFDGAYLYMHTRIPNTMNFIFTRHLNSAPKKRNTYRFLSKRLTQFCMYWFATALGTAAAVSLYFLSVGCFRWPVLHQSIDFRILLNVRLLRDYVPMNHGRMEINIKSARWNGNYTRIAFLLIWVYPFSFPSITLIQKIVKGPTGVRNVAYYKFLV